MHEGRVQHGLQLEVVVIRGRAVRGGAGRGVGVAMEALLEGGEGRGGVGRAGGGRGEEEVGEAEEAQECGGARRGKVREAAGAGVSVGR